MIPDNVAIIFEEGGVVQWVCSNDPIGMRFVIVSYDPDSQARFSVGEEPEPAMENVLFSRELGAVLNQYFSEHPIKPEVYE